MQVSRREERSSRSTMPGRPPACIASRSTRSTARSTSRRRTPTRSPWRRWSARASRARPNQENQGFFRTELDGDTLTIGRKGEHRFHFRWGFDQRRVFGDYKLRVPPSVSLELQTSTARSLRVASTARSAPPPSTAWWRSRRRAPMRSKRRPSTASSARTSSRTSTARRSRP